MLKAMLSGVWGPGRVGGVNLDSNWSWVGVIIHVHGEGKNVVQTQTPGPLIPTLHNKFKLNKVIEQYANNYVHFVCYLNIKKSPIWRDT